MKDKVHSLKERLKKHTGKIIDIKLHGCKGWLIDHMVESVDDVENILCTITKLSVSIDDTYEVEDYRYITDIRHIQAFRIPIFKQAEVNKNENIQQQQQVIKQASTLKQCPACQGVLELVDEVGSSKLVCCTNCQENFTILPDGKMVS